MPLPTEMILGDNYMVTRLQFNFSIYLCSQFYSLNNSSSGLTRNMEQRWKTLNISKLKVFCATHAPRSPRACLRLPEKRCKINACSAGYHRVDWSTLNQTELNISFNTCIERKTIMYWSSFSNFHFTFVINEYALFHDITVERFVSVSLLAFLCPCF